MSLINFLNAKLKPSIECEAISEEGYEVSNLISDDKEKLQRGFMGYSVTKPPTEIVFFFPKAVDLKVLKFWNSQGSLRSTAFEVHSQNGQGSWERIGFVRDLEKGVDTVTFCYQNELLKGNDMHQEGNVFAFFFKTAHKILANTNSIKVTIRATHKCVPVLRKAQVWGLPSRLLDKADRELVLTIWREIVNPFGEKDQQQQSSGQRSPSRCVPELSAHSKLTIPEEFLDAITWEIMVFPTILPSGKIVDQSTIDRHSEVEALWGRSPSDPFTGLEFSVQRKAILDVGLKMRIEKFLTENSAQFKTIPRSLGSRVRRSKNRHASQFANANCQADGGSVPPPAGTYSTLSSIGGKSRKRSPPATITRSLSSSDMQPPAAKELKLSNVGSASAETYRSGLPLFTSAAKQKTLFTPATASATLTSLSTSTTSVQCSSNSLNNAIQRALQHITCYTQLPAAETKSPRCINCKAEEFAYKIQTCRHLVCRDCLVQLSNEQMCACKTSFRSADVERYHKL